MSFTRQLVVTDSSQIDCLWFDSEGGRLSVKFRNGDNWIYSNVTDEEFGLLAGAPSIGSVFNIIIKRTKKGSKLE